MKIKIEIDDHNVLIDGVKYVAVPPEPVGPVFGNSGLKWSQRSLKNMSGVHDHLVEVMNLALSRSPIDMVVIDGLRTRKEQVKLVDIGASWTMNSRHLTGHALDVIPIAPGAGPTSSHWPLFNRLAAVIKEAAADLEVDLQWGGDWSDGYKDGAHWQLSWSEYPLK